MTNDNIGNNNVADGKGADGKNTPAPLAILQSTASTRLNEVQNAYSSAVGNGLSTTKNGLSNAGNVADVKKISDELSAAWEAYKDQDYPGAISHANNADSILSQVIEGRGFGWRATNILALHCHAWLILWIIPLVWLGYAAYVAPLHSNMLTLNLHFINVNLSIPKLLRLLILTAVSGGLGAILRQIYDVSYQVKVRQYQKAISMDVLATPFIGILFGFIAFFILAAGLLVTTQKVSTSSPDLFVAVAFFLGFDWGGAHQYIKGVMQTVLKTPPAQQGGQATAGAPAQTPS